MNATWTALMGVVCAVSAASADTANVSFVGAGQGRNVQMSLGSLGLTVFAGQLRHDISSGTGVAAGLQGIYATFCSDASEFVKYAETPYFVTDLSNLPASGGWAPMGVEREQAVYDLYAAAGGSQLGVSADADLAAAFQVALWEVIYDFNGTRASMDANTGVMRVTETSGAAFSGTMLTCLNSLLDSVMTITAAQSGLIGLGNWGGQDQVVSPVIIPLPNAALMGLAGLASIGVVAAVRRRVK